MLLVELGSYTGVSFCAFCQQIEALRLTCEAYAVDLWRGDANMGQYGEEIYSDLASYVQNNYPGFASLLRMSFDDAIGQFQDRTIDLLHIDGFHSQEAMLHDFDSWLPKMSERGVILMHDIATRLPGYGGPAAWAQISRRFPGFAFSHGYGLGVVLAGSSVPQEVKEMAESSNFAAIAAVFQEQGKIYECLFARHSELVAEQARNAANELGLKHTIADLEGQLQKAREYMQDQQNTHTKELQLLKEKLLESQLQAQAYAGSLSWKITAPLRKLAKLCR